MIKVSKETRVYKVIKARRVSKETRVRKETKVRRAIREMTSIYKILKNKFPSYVNNLKN